MSKQKSDDTLDSQITQLETLSAHKPADVAIRNLLADLYLKKGLVEKAATTYKDAFHFAIEKKEFKLAFEILGKMLFGSSFDILAVKDMLSVLRNPNFQDAVHTFYQLIAQYRLTLNKTLAYTALKRMHQLDPSDERLLQLFREMETPDETEVASLPSFRHSVETSPEMSHPLPQEEPPGPDKSLVLKDKFLELAKEKSGLEAIIMQQHDTIKELEQDKDNLSKSLRKLLDEQKKMKEKLLDYDILRNMEISELKKKVDILISDNKRILTEREAVLQTLDRDQKNISMVDQQKTSALSEEKQRLEELLALAHDDLKNRESIIDVMRTQLASYAASNPQDLHDPFSAASGFQSTLNAAEQDIAAAQAEIRQLTQSLEQVTKEKELSEETLRQETSAFYKEISSLKIDLEELTLSIEEKINQIDALTGKVADLNNQLSHRDTELTEKIPSLLAKINQLSMAIDRKMEENSLFAKELSDLNMKIADLHKELIQKDELLIGLSEDYKEETETQLAWERELEEKINALTGENNRLAQENEALISEARGLRHAAPLPSGSQEETERVLAEAKQQAARSEALLEEQRQEASSYQEEISRLKETLTAQDQSLNTLRDELALKQRDLEALRHSHEEDRTSLEQQIASIMQAMPEKDASLSRLGEELSRYHALCADLQQQLSRLQVQQETADSEHRSSLAALRQTHEEERRLLQDQLESSARSDEDRTAARKGLEQALSLQQQRVAELGEQLTREQERGAGLSASHTAAQDALQARVLELSEKMSRTEAEADASRSLHESISQTLAVREEEIAAHLSRTDELEQAVFGLREALRAKENELSDLREAVAAVRPDPDQPEPDHADASRPAGQELQALNDSLQEKEFLVIDLREQLESAEARLAQQVRAHEEAVSSMEEERAGFHSALADLQARLAESSDQSHADRSVLEEMKSQLSETVKNLLILSDEKKELLAAGSEKDRELTEARLLAGRWQATTGQIQKELAAFKLSSEKQSRLLEALLAEKTSLTARLAELSSVHEQALLEKDRELAQGKNDLAAALDKVSRLEESLAVPAVQTEETPAAQSAAEPAESEALLKPAITEPDERPPSRDRHRKPGARVSRTTVLLLIVFLCLAGYYAYRDLLSPEPQAPQSTLSAPPASPSYDEIFSRDTRSTTSNNIRMQATLITPELLNAGKEQFGPEEYDFARYAYFRVTVSSLKKGLEPSLVKNPASQLSLRTENTTIEPVQNAEQKPAKTFYRREMPVSTAFLAAFPKERPETIFTGFTLVLKVPGNDIALPWTDLPAGSDNKL